MKKLQQPRAFHDLVPIHASNWMHLQTHPIVAARLRRKSWELHDWVYSIETGDVWTYDLQHDMFRSLLQPGARTRPVRK